MDAWLQLQPVAGCIAKFELLHEGLGRFQFLRSASVPIASEDVDAGTSVPANVKPRLH